MQQQRQKQDLGERSAKATQRPQQIAQTQYGRIVGLAEAVSRRQLHRHAGEAAAGLGRTDPPLAARGIMHDKNAIPLDSG